MKLNLIDERADEQNDTRAHHDGTRYARTRGKSPPAARRGRRHCCVMLCVCKSVGGVGGKHFMSCQRSVEFVVVMRGSS